MNWSNCFKRNKQGASLCNNPLKNQISNSCKNPIMKIVNDLIQTVFFIPVLIHPYEYGDPVIDTLCPILMKNQRLKYGPKEKPKSNFIP